MDNILFVDNGRQDEIETFYEVEPPLSLPFDRKPIHMLDKIITFKASQRHRDFYRGYPKAYHPVLYFKEPTYIGQCPAEMTTTYLSYPAFFVKYKQPHVLPSSLGRTSGIPALPDRTLAGRFNKAACKAFIR